jgi:predicted nucleotidyltransferase
LRLRENEAALRQRGVAHASLFGSRVRGDNRPDSDTDIMIEIDPEAHVTVFDYAGLKEYIASLFDGPVDVVSRHGLKPMFVRRRPLIRSMPSKSLLTALTDILHHIERSMPLPGALKLFPKPRVGFRLP